MSAAEDINHAGMIPLRKSQITSAAHMLARAFVQDPKLIHAFPDDKRRKESLHYLLEFELRYGMIYGQVYTTSPDMEGISFWLPSRYATITTWRAIRAGGAWLPFQIGLRSFLKGLPLSDHIDRARKRHITGSYTYWFIIGVDPAHQGKGHAGRLIRHMLKNLDDEGLRCYLVTENKDRVSLYEHFGFKVVDCYTVPGTDVKNWAMIRTPVKHLK